MKKNNKMPGIQIMNNKTNRGGHREGSGRKCLGRVNAVSVRLSDEAYEILKEKENKSEFIDKLIRATR